MNFIKSRTYNWDKPVVKSKNLISIQRHRKTTSLNKNTNKRGIQQLLTWRWKSKFDIQIPAADSARRDLQVDKAKQTTPFFSSSEVCVVLGWDTLCWPCDTAVSTQELSRLHPAYSLNMWQSHTSRHWYSHSVHFVP